MVAAEVAGWCLELGGNAADVLRCLEVASSVVESELRLEPAANDRGIRL